MDLRTTAVLLTGASSGIGLATAKALAERGARLALVARNAEKLAAAALDLDGAVAITADVTDPDQAGRAVREAVTKLRRIDVLINNAGRTMFSPVEAINLELYRELLELNVIAPLRLMQLVAPIMRGQGGGTILNVSSMVTRTNIPMIGGYSSTKYAMNSLTLTAREELAKDGIRVCLIRPGLVDTEFGANTAMPEPDALRRTESGELHAYVHSSEAVAAKILELLDSDLAELDFPNAH